MRTMRLLAIDTCPLWQEDDGTCRPGLEYEPDHLPVVGWVNVVSLDIDGVKRQLLLA